MKNYTLDDIKEKYNLEDDSWEENSQELSSYINKSDYSIEEFDKAKTRVLKYIVFKKRTEKEIRDKFYKDYDENLLNDVILNLKELGYIDDEDYIKRALNEYMALKNMSAWEIKYKLLSKGLKSDIIDKYFDENSSILYDFEVKSAKAILKKKQGEDLIKVKAYLSRKGYKQDIIREVIDE